MRTIKFRGKRIDTGEWVYGDLLRNRGEVFIVPDGIANPFATAEDFRVDPDTIGEFTGLFDKNGKGKEIYEGDVFRFVNDCCETNICEIVFVEGGLCVYYEENDAEMYLIGTALQIWGDKAELIGNIHDNPERLKQ